MDWEAHERLLEELRPALAKRSGRLLNHPEDREDALQNVYLKVLRRIRTKGLFRSKETLLKYLFGAASSAPYDILRKEFGRD